MLKLALEPARRVGQTLMIGEDASITVTLIGIKGNQAKIGIDASMSTSVHREEVYRRILAGADKPIAANEDEMIPTEIA